MRLTKLTQDYVFSTQKAAWNVIDCEELCIDYFKWYNNLPINIQSTH